MILEILLLDILQGQLWFPSIKFCLPQGQDKISVVEDKMDKVIQRELEDVRQEHDKLQGAVKDQGEKKEALMKETQQLKEMV